MRLHLQWSALLIAVFVAFTVVAQPSGLAAAAEPSLQPNASVAATALKYDGTYQGECWGFVKRVVFEATGRQMGFDYRQGFFDGGAIEVTLADAQAGDVIQFADDSNTEPWADYPGLHTAIILDRTSTTTFDIVDSNSEWDGIVHTRQSYSPVDEAAMKGLSFHIYRFPGGGTPAAPTSQTLSTPTSGQQVAATVATPNDCLNLRDAASTSAAIRACMPDGTTLAVLGSQPDSSGRTWANVVTPFGSGWAAGEYLVPVAPASADEPASQADAKRTPADPS